MSACRTGGSGILNRSCFSAAKSGGRWYSSLDQRSMQIPFGAGRFWFHIPSWQQQGFRSSFFLLHVQSVLQCVSHDWKRKKKDHLTLCEGAGGFTTLQRTCITHLAEGYTCRFKASLNIRLSEMQLKKAQNTPIRRRTNGFSVAGDVRPINWETEHDWGPVSSRVGKGWTGWWMTTGQRKGRRDSGKDMRGRWNRWLST